MDNAQMRAAGNGAGECEGDGAVERVLPRGIAWLRPLAPGITQKSFGLGVENFAFDRRTRSGEGKTIADLRPDVVRHHPGGEQFRHGQRPPHLFRRLGKVIFELECIRGDFALAFAGH